MMSLQEDDSMAVMKCYGEGQIKVDNTITFQVLQDFGYVL